MTILNNAGPTGSAPSLVIQDEIPAVGQQERSIKSAYVDIHGLNISIGNIVDSKIQPYQAEVQRLSTEIKDLKSDHKATETLLLRQVLRANRAEEKTKTLKDDYTELNKDYASLYNEHRDLMHDHATLKRDHASLEASFKTTNRNLSTITHTVDHIVRALGMQNVGSRARLGSEARTSVWVRILEKHTRQEDKLDSVSRKIDRQLGKIKKEIQAQEERLTEQFTEQVKIIDDKVFEIVDLLHNENTGGISRDRFVDELEQLYDQMVAEVKGRRQIMFPEHMEGIDDDIVHFWTEENQEVEEVEEVEEDGIRSRYWP